MKLLTLLYFFLWSLTSFTQDQESLTLTHGTFTYFAKCKDGVICVSDSRVTKTKKIILENQNRILMGIPRFLIMKE